MNHAHIELAHGLLAKSVLSKTKTDFAEHFRDLSATQLADLFVKCSFLAALGRAMSDQHWLLTQNKPELEHLAQSLLQRQMSSELKSIDFVSDLLLDADTAQIQRLAKSSAAFAEQIVFYSRLDQNSGSYFQEFACACMSEMAKLSLDQNLIRENAFSESMYRAFDAMDDVFGLDYHLDDGMKLNMTERLYEGGAVGVQTSYATLLLTFANLVHAPGAVVVDLGSGFGRVGLTLGLLRSDVHFIGYEYVDHRVRSSQDAADRAGLSKIKFATQDLSRAEFKIPLADTYYMYDPFNKETYGYVLGQLIDIGKTKPITIVTKGRANTWATDALITEGWITDKPCDNGLVLIFRSPILATAGANTVSI